MARKRKTESDILRQIWQSGSVSATDKRYSEKYLSELVERGLVIRVRDKYYVTGAGIDVFWP